MLGAPLGESLRRNNGGSDRRHVWDMRQLEIILLLISVVLLVVTRLPAYISTHMVMPPSLKGCSGIIGIGAVDLYQLVEYPAGKI